MFGCGLMMPWRGQGDYSGGSSDDERNYGAGSRLHKYRYSIDSSRFFLGFFFLGGEGGGGIVGVAVGVFSGKGGGVTQWGRCHLTAITARSVGSRLGALVEVELDSLLFRSKFLTLMNCISHNVKHVISNPIQNVKDYSSRSQLD